MTSPLISIEGITKSFAGVEALRGVTFSVDQGEIHALVGENGAGKSTLMRILAGAEQPDEGMLVWRGEQRSFATPAAAIEAGIATIYQELSLVPNLSVAENILLGHEPLSTFGFVDWNSMTLQATELLSSLGLGVSHDADVTVEALSVADRQILEIAKAVSRDAKLLIMDEPTASLGEGEVPALFDTIRLLRDQGVGIIYISHRLEEVLEIADRVTILRDGALVTTVTTGSTSIADLIALIVGRDVSPHRRRESIEPYETILSARGLSVPPWLESADFIIRAGEIVGVWGLIGSGRSTLARALAGLVRGAHGTITVHGTAFAASDIVAATRAGVIYLAEDRKTQGLMLGRSLRENAALASLPSRSVGGFIRFRAERQAVSGIAQRLHLRTPSLEMPVRNLSGGNQQKTMLARALLADPQVLIVDEPTHGVDVGAKAEIHQLLQEFANRGRGIVFVSSELPEVVALADRIIVMSEGTVAAELSPSAAAAEIMLAATTPVHRT